MDKLKKCELKAYIEYLLKNYVVLEKDLKFMEYELNMFKGMTNDEAIGALAFHKLENGFQPDNRNASDKTGFVALGYQEFMNRMNSSARNEILKQYFILHHELEFLKHCVDKLPQKQRNIMQVLYLKGSSWAEALDRFAISRQCMARQRNAAVEKIVIFYEERHGGFNDFLDEFALVDQKGD